MESIRREFKMYGLFVTLKDESIWNKKDIDKILPN